MSDTANSPATTPKKPRYRKQFPNGISVAVFEHSRDGRTYRSINLQRSYRHNGEWSRKSIYLDQEHIPFVQEALKSVWDYMLNGLHSSVEGQDATEGDETSSAEEPEAA